MPNESAQHPLRSRPERSPAYLALASLVVLPWFWAAQARADPSPVPIPPYYSDLPADFAQSYLQGYYAFLNRNSSDYPPANVAMSPNDTISWICLSQQRAARSRGQGPTQASAFNEGCLHAARANAGQS